MRSSTGWFLLKPSRILLALGCLFLLCLVPALAEETPGQQSEQQQSQPAVPSYTIDKGYVVPSLVNPGEPEAPKKLQRRGGARGGPLYHVSYGAKRTRKLIRGAHNVIFGWIEIPKTIMNETVMVDPLTGFVTGFVQGTAKGIERTGVGAVEILTFWHEWPREYRPLIEPEYVWGDLTD